MRIVHLMASPFYGGPEKQMLGLARNLPASYESAFVTFAERGLSKPFVDEARRHGFEARTLKNNFPRVGAAIREVAEQLCDLRADVLCCSGYKPDLVGWRAARRVGIPVVAVAHGWTGITRKVRFYEAADRIALRWFDAVACVSEGQAVKARKAGVAERLLHVIRNAIDVAPFEKPLDPRFRERMHALFPSAPRFVVGAVGRLSPEKGFEKFIESAAITASRRQDIGFVIFGEGPLRTALEQQIADAKLQGRVVLGGFHANLECWLPHLDVGVSSSYTEGLPVAILEAQAAGVPMVATSVGGTPEVVLDGVNGYLVDAGDAEAIASRVEELLNDAERRRDFGVQGSRRVREEFNFAAQVRRYEELFESLAPRPRTVEAALLSH